MPRHAHLNPDQRLAVTTTEGALLVLAGAGSGKTRVVVHRIAHLLDSGAPPEAILAVTFTNKAAGEMRARVAALTGKRIAERLTVSTFHAFGARVLEDHITRLDYGKRFAIFDTQDQLATLKRVLATVSLGDRAFDANRIQGRISRAKCAGIDPETFIDGADPEDDYERILCEVYPRYQAALKAMNAVDFDDLILLPLLLLRDHREVRAAYHGRYRHFLVDEYQDTSRVQVRLLTALAAKAESVCAVGDDDQSIYAWRGAEVDHILKFEDTFPGAKEVRLTRNYRSTGHILDAANAVIAKNAARRGKDLWTEAGDGEPVKLVVCPDEEDEARFVVDELERLGAEERFRRDDFAILFRTNGQSRAFEEVLRARGIGYRLVGGTRFFDRKEVRDGLAWLRLLANPRDDVSLLRAVHTPPRGIGDATLERLGRAARETGGTLWDAMRRVEDVEGCERAVGPVLGFVDLVERHRHRAGPGARLDAVATALFEESGLVESVRTGTKRAAAAAARLANLEALTQSLGRFCEREARPTLPAYLARVALDGREDGEDGEAGQVVLLTLHAAKGLEFPVVFLAGCEEGLLPHEGMQGMPPDLPEERRLAYVGITRARRHLYLTRAATRRRRGRVDERIPSRFLEDLPEASFEVVDAAAKAGPLTGDALEAGRAFLARIQAGLAPEPDEG